MGGGGSPPSSVVVEGPFLLQSGSGGWGVPSFFSGRGGGGSPPSSEW